jgi:SAM-dependent methyltransferase
VFLQSSLSTQFSPTDLKQLYAARFEGKAAYRKRVWHELCSFLKKWIPGEASVLDLGCGHCEFINAVQCGRKLGMDLNPDASRFAANDVNIIQQDCSESWSITPETLDAVFTSNFLEHLPTKNALEQTLQQAYRALAPGGRLIAMGPNIKYLPGAYWDFFDHYLPLTELALTEVLKKCGFKIEFCRGRFLPYTMSDGKEYPIWGLRAYLALPVAWRIFGRQFLVIASKPIESAGLH